MRFFIQFFLSFFNGVELIFSMRKEFVLIIAGFFLAVYFALTIFVLPENYLSNDQLVPKPHLETNLSDIEINLGDSFHLDIFSKNVGDYGDIHIVSVAFPNLHEIEDDVVQITTYDFTQSPRYLLPGDVLGSNYSGGLESIISEYPSIESMSRPIRSGQTHNIEFIITPQNTGNFTIYVKSINIPHTDDLSHFPQTGILDHQNEYVLPFVVGVNL